MAKITISEQAIQQITEKYVKSVHRKPNQIPNIRSVVEEALRDITPDKKINEQDVMAVLQELTDKTIINDKVIAEVAKKVTDHTAHEDLIFSVRTYAKQLNKKVTEKDIEEIVKGLNPYTSTPFQIKNAVRDYFEGSRPVEAMAPEEIKDIIRTELAKKGPIDDRDVRAVLQKYLQDVDKEKPFREQDIRDVVKSHLTGKPVTLKPDPIRPEPLDVPPIPQPEPIQRPGEPGKPTPPPPRSALPPPPIEPGDPVPPKDKKNPNFFERVRAKMYRYGLKSLTIHARNWLKDSVNKAKNIPARRKLIAQGTTVHEAFIGKMFLYFYDAKGKEELPYWDKFPLIVCVDMAEDGWYGLNLHYLPIPLRIKLFDALLTLADNPRLDRIERLRLNYGLLRGFSSFPEAKPCFKRYLASNVKSDLLEVEPVDWETAVFLPVEQFQKETKETVWKRSRAKIKERQKREARRNPPKKD